MLKECSKKKDSKYFQLPKTFLTFFMSLMLITGLVGAASVGVVPAELGVKNSATSVWSGSSAHLETTGSVGSGDEARVVIQASSVGVSTLNDLNSISWEADSVSGYTPHVDVYLDLNNNGNYDSGTDDVLVFEYAKVNPADCDDSGDYPTGDNINTFGDKGIVDNNAYAWLNSGDAGPCGGATFYHHSLSGWKAGQTENGKTISGASKVLRFEVEVDNWVSQSEAYVNNIKINNIYSGRIQNAIDAANPGDTINIAAGTYSEDLVINKTIILQGADKSTTIIKGVINSPKADWPLARPNIDIQADNVVITGFTIESPNWGLDHYTSGIVIDGQNVEIYNNNFIISDANNYDEVSQAITTYSKLAIPTVDVSNLNIHDNTFTGGGSVGYEGIYINPHDSTGLTLNNNDFSGNLAVGVSIEAGDVAVTDNTINNVGGAGLYGIRFIELQGGKTYSGVLISGNTIENVAKGVRVGTSSDVGSSLTATLSSNIFSGNTQSYDMRYGASITYNANTHNVVSGESIQTAITGAQAGDKISVAAGTYSEDLVINKTIELAGANKATTIIKGVANVPATSWPLAVPNIDVQADGVKIHGFTIQGPDYVSGKYVSGMVIDGQNIEIYDNNFAPTKVDASNELGQAIITYSKTAIPGADVSGLNIHNNAITCSGIVGCEGIYINPHTGTGTINIKNNQLSGSINIGITVESGKATVDNNTVNTIVDKESGPYGTYGIRFFDSTYAATYNNIMISNNNVQNFKRGIRVGNGGAGTTSITAIVQSNTLTGNNVGIWARAYGVTSLTALSNSLIGNTKGIQNDGAITVNAENNWWETTTESSIQALISGNADYDPWCTDSTCATTATVVCDSNAECNDGNANTEDVCLNAGTIISSCSNGAISCKSNSDCNDGNSYTTDVCNNPGTASSSCSHSTIICLSDSDCGTSGFVGGTICSDRDVWANYKNYAGTCKNAGTSTSYCASSETKLTLKESCSPNYCLSGSCSVRCQSNSDCDDGNANTEDVCLNAGTASASCSNKAIACFKDSDCPSAFDSGAEYCGAYPSKNVLIKQTSYTCENKGTASAYCKDTTAPRTVQTCDLKCENAKCISNAAPVIISTPVLTATEGILYKYDVDATDADGNKLWYSDNSALFNIDSLTGLISFTPTKAIVGTHEITISVTDGFETATQTYNLEIIGVNSKPILNSIGNLIATEGILYEKTITASDSDGDSLIFSDDTNLFDISSSGKISFTPTSSDVGEHKVTIMVDDKNIKVSENIKFMVLAKEIVNTAPRITSYLPLTNPTISELETQEFSVKTEDDESHPTERWYDNGVEVAVGDEYAFVGNNKMGESNAGIHFIKIVVSDGILTTERLWTLTVTREKDADGDGILDKDDNCIFVANTNQEDSNNNGIGNACEGNLDGDAIDDDKDFVAGTVTNVDSNIKLNLEIENSENLNREITGTQSVVFKETETATPIVNFEFDFSATEKLDLSQVEIKKQSGTAEAGEVIIRGIDLTAQAKTKTIYMDRIKGTDTICIKDAEIASIKEISNDCTGANEYLITCNGVEKEGYKCSIKGSQYEITGLKHSGVKESVPNNVPVITFRSPAEQIQYLEEGTSLTFSVTATDNDAGDVLSYKWFLHDETGPGKTEVSTTSSYIYVTADGDAGVRGVSVEVSDGKDKVVYKWAIMISVRAAEIKECTDAGYQWNSKENTCWGDEANEFYLKATWNPNKPNYGFCDDATDCVDTDGTCVNKGAFNKAKTSKCIPGWIASAIDSTSQCGDEPNEFYLKATWNPANPVYACCDEATDCVDVDGSCVNKGAFNKANTHKCIPGWLAKSLLPN